MRTIVIGGKRVHIFLPEGSVRLKIWTHMQPDEAAALFERAGGGTALFAADDYDWNADLSPWPAKACFRGGEDFAGRGPERLRWLGEAVPVAEEGIADAPRAILGYSLAGLFALWAAAERNELFDAAASVSGSLWYDDFAGYIAARAHLFAGKAAYLSLGDREAKTRNARLACVQEAAETARDVLCAAGARAVFELNPGNHFNDPTGRCARAVEWLKEAMGTLGDSVPYNHCQGE